MAFPSVIATSDQDASGVNHSFNWPASGIQAGDLLLAFYIRGNNAPGGTPSGLTSLGADSVTNDFYARMYAKVATGSENGTSFTVNGSISDPGSCITYQIRGWSGNLLEIGVGTFAGPTTSSNPNPPSVTCPNGAGDNLYIAIAWMGSAVIASAAPSGFTNLITETNTGIGIATAIDENTAASLNPGSFTASSSVWMANTIVIPPFTDTVVTPTTASLTTQTFAPTVSIAYVGPRLLLEFTGKGQGTDTNVTSEATPSISPSANSALVLFVANSPSSGTANTPSVSGISLTWTRIATVEMLDFFTSWRIHAFVAFPGASPGSGSITMNFSGQTQARVSWAVVEVDGADRSSVGDFVPQFAESLGQPDGFFVLKIRTSNRPYLTMKKKFSSLDNGVLVAIVSTVDAGPMSGGFGYTELYDLDNNNIGVQCRATPDRTPDFVMDDIATVGMLALEIGAEGGRVIPEY